MSFRLHFPVKVSIRSNDHINSHENKQGNDRLAGTVLLRRWEGKTCKFGFIKRVYKGRITTVKDLES